ncbi:MAG: hypothetical protein KY447_06720 [Actinobacteria bacterium]|nr:hypothetical protein [Actinomycetota bacterium]MBW3642590.1 hypothetical protein [Actinomycetota bacterium]
MAEAAIAASPRSERHTPSFAVVHDIDGPRVRWGIVWFVVTVVSAAVSRPLLAGVMALAAGLATDQVLRLRDADEVARSGGRVGGLLSDPRRLPAMIAAGALPLAAAAGGDTLAATLPTVVVVVLVQRLCTSASQPPQANAVADASMAVAVAAGVGLAAAGPVLAHRFGAQAAVVVLVMICAYDAGDYLVGSGSSTLWEGPAAGVVAVAVVGFAMSVVPLEPVDASATFALAVLTGLLAPLGPPAASLLVGSGRRPARHLRRLDSLLLLGPLLPYALAAIL